MYRTKILMCNARLCLAKKKTEISSQKSVKSERNATSSLRDHDRALEKLEVGRHGDAIAADF